MSYQNSPNPAQNKKRRPSGTPRPLNPGRSFTHPQEYSYSPAAPYPATNTLPRMQSPASHFHASPPTVHSPFQRTTGDALLGYDMNSPTVGKNHSAQHRVPHTPPAQPERSQNCRPCLLPCLATILYLVIIITGSMSPFAISQTLLQGTDSVTPPSGFIAANCTSQPANLHHLYLAEFRSNSTGYQTNLRIGYFGQF